MTKVPYAPYVTGQTGHLADHGIIADALYPLFTDEKRIFVTPRGSDSNDGTNLRNAKATLEGAVAALGGTRGRIIGGYGTIPVGDECDLSAAAMAGSVIEGMGMGLTTFEVSVALSYAIKILNAQQCSLRDFSLVVASGGSVADGIIVTATTSTQETSIENIWVREDGTGTITNGFSFGPDTTTDVAQITVVGCRATGASNAGFRSGNGTSGNVLAIRYYSIAASACGYGVLGAGSGVRVHGADMALNTISDFACTGIGVDPYYISDVRSEASNRLWTMVATAAAANAVFEGVMVSTFTDPAGKAIKHEARAPLTLIGVTIRQGSVTQAWQVGNSAVAPTPLTLINVVTDVDVPCAAAANVVRTWIGLRKEDSGTGLLVVPTMGTNGSDLATPIQTRRASGGAIAVVSTTWIDLDTALDIVIPNVVAGEWIGVGLDGLAENQSSFLFLDAVSWVSAAAVNSWSGLAIAAGSNGVSGWTCPSTQWTALGPTVWRQVVAGDIASGTLTIRMRTRVNVATSHNLRASTDNALTVTAYRR